MACSSFLQPPGEGRWHLGRAGGSLWPPSFCSSRMQRCRDDSLILFVPTPPAQLRHPLTFSTSSAFSAPFPLFAWGDSQLYPVHPGFSRSPVHRRALNECAARGALCSQGHSWDTAGTLGSLLGAWATPWQVCCEGTEGFSGNARIGEVWGETRSIPVQSAAAHSVVGLWTSFGREDDPTLTCYSCSGSPAAQVGNVLLLPFEHPFKHSCFSSAL